MLIELSQDNYRSDEIENDPMFIHIGKRYNINYCKEYNSVDLRDGYQLNYVNYCPINHKRSNTNIILFDWLFLKKGFTPRQDGMIRGRRFIKYMEDCPCNPYKIIIFNAMGCEKDKKPDKKFSETKHSTEDLIKMYAYWGKAQETNQPTPDRSSYFYRLDCYQPKHLAVIGDDERYLKLYNDKTV